MQYFIRYIKVFLSFSIIAAVILTFLSIISYNNLDPSIFNAVEDHKIYNFLGKYGALIADPTLQIIGYSVILPIIFFLIFSIKLFNNRPNKFLIYRSIALLFAIVVASILLAFIPCYFSMDDEIGFGGVIGDYLKQFSLIYVDDNILLISLILAFIVLTIFCLGLSFAEWKLICKYMYMYIKFFAKGIRYIVSKLSYQKKKLNPEFNITENLIEEPEDVILEKDKKIMFKKAISTLDQEFVLPSVDILKEVKSTANLGNGLQVNELRGIQEKLKKVLKDYGVKGEMLSYSVGPVVTLYEFEPIAGTKASRVIGLADDISRSMSAVSTRIAVIPGKNALGIEIPNEKREVIYLRNLVESKEYQQTNFKLPLILGKDIAGRPVIADLARMPHLLVAGTTGSGKSVAINTMILSLLYAHTVKKCRFVMIDPKMLELSVYDGIPHLLSPVVTEPKKAVEALRWVVQEMERRYRAMASLGVRNITGFNELLTAAAKEGTTLKKVIQTGFDSENGEPTYEEVDLGSEALPCIVVIVDEMADLMLVAGKEIEGYIQRIAQMARASGIHLIMATQRPSVDVITGVIKANFPTRISFHVTSKIDSRTILGEQGAEQLLGMGDMLYMISGGGVMRVHGPFVSDVEVENVVKELKKKNSNSGYSIDFNITQSTVNSDQGNTLYSSMDNSKDLYQQAIEVVLKDQRATTSYIQRRLKIGYNKAASFIEQMEQEGIISVPNSQGKREILQKKNNIAT
jgi:S-DNA-T family DNA segregation ATPase FtsK/SpoIIIE